MVLSLRQPCILCYWLYLLLYCHHSQPYHSSVGHNDHTPSSPPHPLYGPSRPPTGAPYPVLVHRPLWCRPDLIIGLHQRGVTENEQTCGLSLYCRPCLSFGLSWLVLPIIRSVRRLLAPRTIIPVPDDVRTMKSAFSLDFWSNIIISCIKQKKGRATEPSPNRKVN